MHAKSASAYEVCALLTARKLIQGKLLDIESGIRGVLRGFGLKVGSISRMWVDGTSFHWSNEEAAIA